MSDNHDHSKQTGHLGTFAGVFTPSILTILGIILFMRLGYVVGNAGLGRALLIIALANAVSVLTAFSLSAIATNLKVKGGGDYYLISRTLGVEFGGAIGIVLYLAQSVSIAFYSIGFGEVLSPMLPWNQAHLSQFVAASAVVFLGIFAWLGADWASRFQYLVMTVLGLALASFFIGGAMKWDASLLADNWTTVAGAPGFWVIFAIFFPAVTGFTQGVSMSGDLKDAGKSLPAGTFLAVGLSIVIYFAAAIVLAGAQPAVLLASDYEVMAKTAWIGAIVGVGVIAATLSSAMASFLGAPRILQSLAGDRIFPVLLPFAKGSGAFNNPRRGVLLSAAIAFVAIALGNLNLIAPIVSMFFLISYGLLNYATYCEARSGSPAFRPRFRWFDRRLSLLGCLACLGIILAIDPVAGLVALSVLFAIYQYLKRTAGPARWADSQRSYHLQRVRENLLAAAAEQEHPRDWRPQILALSDEPALRTNLLRFASWLEGESGFTTLVTILEGEGVTMLKRKTAAEDELKKELARSRFEVFPLVVVARSFHDGLYALVQSSGIGPLKANTILLSWFDPLPRGLLVIKEQRLAQNLRTAFRFGCNIVILKADDDPGMADLDHRPQKEFIDVWWQDDMTGQLSLLLAYLITRHEHWRDKKLRVFATAGGDNREGLTDHLKTLLQEARIDADVRATPAPTASDAIAFSQDAALVFVPFRLRREEFIGPFERRLDELIPDLPLAALVLAAKDIDLDAEPDEGAAAEMAAVMDAVSDAEQKARQAESSAERAAKEAGEKLAAARTSSADESEEQRAAKIKAAAEAEKNAQQSARKAAKARAKAEDAARAEEEMGTKSVEEEGRETK